MHLFFSGKDTWTHLYYPATKLLLCVCLLLAKVSCIANYCMPVAFALGGSSVCKVIQQTVHWVTFVRQFFVVCSSFVENINMQLSKKKK